MTDLHGGLLVLSEVAIAYRDAEPTDALDVRMRDVSITRLHQALHEPHTLHQIFQHLSLIPFDVVVGSRNAIVTTAACRLIAITLTQTEIQLGGKSTVPHWRKIIDHGLKHRTPSVQEAAADAMARVSKLVDCSSLVIR